MTFLSNVFKNINKKIHDLHLNNDLHAKSGARLMPKKQSNLALGLVESLIAIAIAGTLIIAMQSLSVAMLRQVKKNEYNDLATQEAIYCLELSRAIRDSGWSTADNKPPSPGEYEIYYDSGVKKFVFLPVGGVPQQTQIKLESELFSRTIEIGNISNDVVLLKIKVICAKDECLEIKYEQNELFKINSI